jgi:Holliday junction resolvase RusA-like endonuclease
MKPPNLNDRSMNRAGGRGASRQAFAWQAAKFRRARGQWVLMIRNAMQWAKCPRSTDLVRRVAYVRIMGKGEREWDYDNLVGGGKMVFDAMIEAGLIVDDSAKWCVREYSQERGPVSGLRLEVTDA